jgi:hypothetical protein
MFKIKTLYRLYCSVLYLVTINVDSLNNLGMVLVLHRRLLSWSGSRVSPRSCPLHYPAASRKSAATLGPHCGAFIGRL